MPDTIAILGAGSWGITLTKILSEKGHKINLWENDKKQAENLKIKRSFKFLPGLKIPKEVFISSEPVDVIKGARIIIFAVPSQVIAESAQRISSLIKQKNAIIVIATKGIDADKSLRMSEMVKNQISSDVCKNISVLSGPTIAIELVKKMPTVAVVACENLEIAKYIQERFMTPYFRLYTSTDVIGVEMGGALKNIIAIAAGVGDGLGLGTNTKAALMTRGIVEITRLGIAMGAKAETFAGLSGMGDLITTCISRYSRNRTFGEKIGQGKTLKQALDKIEMVVEGVKTTQGVYNLARRQNIDMPITGEVYNILFKQKDPRKAVGDLMTREAKTE